MSVGVVPSAGVELGATAKRSRRGLPIVTQASLIVVCGVVIMAAFGATLAPHNPDAQNLALTLRGPSSAHWLGTDALGRDIFSRLIAGARTAFIGPLVIALGSSLFGSLLGLFAGYRGGSVDGLVMRWVDLMMSVPHLLVLIVVAGAVQGGYWTAVALILILSIPGDTRIVRGATLAQVHRPYVEAAKTLGVPGRRIMIQHIWPNVAPVIVANGFLIFAHSLIALAALSFLGLGAPVGTPDWGLMLSSGQSLLFLNPVSVLAPGAMIVLVAVAMNLLGDSMYEWLSSRGATR